MNMECKVSHRTISAYADDELSLPQMRVVSTHLKGCAACQERFRRIKTGAEALASLSAAPADLALEDRIVAYVSANIDNQPEAERVILQLADWRVAAAAVLLLLTLAYSAPGLLIAHSPHLPAWAKTIVVARQRVDNAIIASENAISDGAYMLISYREPPEKERR
jgi:anti-sigma factor RsiW